MLALLSRDFPEGEGWIYEPKWDGFRALIFWDGEEMLLQSRDLRPLGRYFPELVGGLKATLQPGTVLDGEIVIAGSGGLDFDALLQRIHPAESRIKKLAAETPASFVAFDLLACDSQSLIDAPFHERREQLAKALGDRRHPLYLTPATTDPKLGGSWFTRFEGAGLDGVIAKRPDLSYRPDQRLMVKVKHLRTAETVVGGFRWAKDQAGEAVGSLLLGLYSNGRLQHVGHTSSFKAAERRALVTRLEPYRDGRSPGGPSRWNAGKDLSWESLRPELVCEVSFDHLQGDRFRHAATFQRWRPDKPPAECTYDELTSAVPMELAEIFGL
jgi:ATP-dependent DNA ligase